MKNKKILDKLFTIYKKHVLTRKPSENSQLCMLWHGAPDVLETTEQLNDINDAFGIYIEENDAVEMFDMNLLEASDYLKKVFNINIP
jgi:hypothetical protein